MKRIIAAITIIGVMISVSALSYASDWDKAGKALAIIEGARIITGGNVDIIGNLTGIGRNSRQGPDRRSRRYSKARNSSCSSQPAWVPNFVWKKRYIPEHKEYSEKYGTIIVEGHYIRYKAADGGHWE